MKQKFSVTITEVLKHTVAVKAKTKDEAIQAVSDGYYAEKCILSADDFYDVSFTTN